MNPYESPTKSGQHGPQESAPSEMPERRFRWRVIPAGISWLLGALVLLALPFAVYNNCKHLSIDFASPLPWVLLDVAKLAMFPVMLAYGCAFLYAGDRWMKGRWLAAVLLHVLAGAMLVSLTTAMEYLREWAINLP